MWKSKGKKLEKLEKAIHDFPHVNEENEKKLKTLFIEARNVTCSLLMNYREDLNISRGIFTSELHRDPFYGWDIKEIITDKLIKKIFSEGMEYYGAGKFVKKWMAHGPFRNKIELIIWLIDEVRYVQLLRDGTKHIYADEYFCSENGSDVLELDKEKIEKLLAVSNLKEQSTIKELVAKHVESMIEKIKHEKKVRNSKIKESNIKLTVLTNREKQLTDLRL